METVETLVFAENGFPIEDRLGKVKETLGALLYEKKIDLLLNTTMKEQVAIKKQR
jgi:hypothetical protein